jgi:hypothetical protein
MVRARAALFLAVWLVAVGAPAAGPVVAPAKSGTQCVADPGYMRRNHMSLLKHQRDDTVRGGIRGAAAHYSLRQCIDCHANAKTGSVIAEPTDFCTSCHRYAAVSIDCFDCHSGKSATLAARGTQ